MESARDATVLDEPFPAEFWRCSLFELVEYLNQLCGQGTVLDDDQLTANLKLRIKVKSVKAFGVIPLAGGNSCQTKQLSDIALASTDSFDPTGTGGTLGGTYKISDLNGCGPLNGLVSPLTAGGGNTILVNGRGEPRS